MKRTPYLWIIILLFVAVISSTCTKPEPEPEPCKYEVTDPYIVPSLADNIQQKDNLIGTWALCGVTNNEHVEPWCTDDPSSVPGKDTLVFTDSTFTKITPISSQTWTLAGHTDTSFTYYQNNTTVYKRIKYRNYDKEMLIFGWSISNDWSGYSYYMACFHKID